MMLPKTINSQNPYSAKQSPPLTGSLRVPSDKSLSHRALLLAALAHGKSEIRGLLPAGDVLGLAMALQGLGVKISTVPPYCFVESQGLASWREPETVLDMGNSGTATRLLLGLLAACPFSTFLQGDASLQRRPMARVIKPLIEMGAFIHTRSQGRLPLVIQGRQPLRAIRYQLPVASAQVKSALLLAGLFCGSESEIIEPTPTRDHTERALKAMGIKLTTTDFANGGLRHQLQPIGKETLAAQRFDIPADISSAAFPMVAALLIEGSEIILQDVCLNPTRTGLLLCLTEMGANIKQLNPRQIGFEPVADLHICASTLSAITTPASRAASMIDEFPILAMACACARGTSRLTGLAELRVKESDRLQAIAQGLTACGVRVEIDGDDLIIHGEGTAPKGGAPKGDALIKTDMDHRIAMSFLILGLVSQKPITIDDSSFINTSYPDFIGQMQSLGATLTQAEST